MNTKTILTMEKGRFVIRYLSTGDYTPLTLIAEPRHYRELGYMLIGFIIAEVVAFGVALLVIPRL